jgi:hypothetical protein
MDKNDIWLLKSAKEWTKFSGSTANDIKLLEYAQFAWKLMLDIGRVWGEKDAMVDDFMGKYSEFSHDDALDLITCVHYDWCKEFGHDPDDENL